MQEKTLPGIRIETLKGLEEKELIPCFFVLSGELANEVFRIINNTVLIGRSSEADFFLKNDSISRKHARVDLQGETYTLTDLESTNGTIVNGQNINQVSLKHGDVIQIGDTQIRFGFYTENNLQNLEDSRTKAVRDSLTNIANRQFFLETLKREVNYSIRQRQPLTCIILDIDHFQKVNEEFGHDFGDQILQLIAENLMEGLRAYDLICRYGGEEFAILLRDTALDNALVFAERVRKRIEGLEIDREGHEISLTVSMGVSTSNPDYVQEANDLLRQADRYLFEAKKRGRNQICSPRNSQS